MDSRVCVHYSLDCGVLVLYIYEMNNIRYINGNPHVNVVKILRCYFELYNELTDNYINGMFSN